MNDIDKAVKILRAGGVVAYPTDTAYGFGVDATNIKAVNKLYELKGRDYSKPVSVIFPNMKAASKVVKLSTNARKLASHYFPGPLTLVLPMKVKGKSWDILSAKSGTLGIRCPDNEIALELVKKLKRPITSTSANVSGKPTTYSVREIKRQYPGKTQPDFYLDGGKLDGNSLSTMLHIEGKHVTLLREGVINYYDIIKFLL